MSTNTWQKRETTSLTCPTGNVAVVRGPGPDLALKAGKVSRIFAAQGEDVQKNLAYIESLPDAELDKLMAFARVVIVDVVVSPVIVSHPKEGQIGPDDVPLADFWHIFTWAMKGGPSLPVKLAEGETTVDAVETFPAGQEPSLNPGADSEQVS